jgi:hypothetical protein
MTGQTLHSVIQELVQKRKAEQSELNLQLEVLLVPLTLHEQFNVQVLCAQKIL